MEIAGMHFGEWNVIDDNIVNGKVLCRCSCGVERQVNLNNLKNGLSTNCGHKRLNIDILGKHFGEWEVLEYIGKNKYKCRCSCGVEKSIRKYDLTSGVTKSCGHKNLDKNLVGRRINDWTILEYVGNSMYKCRCSCGEIKNIQGYTITSGRSKSCGHNSNKFIDRTNTRVDNLDIIEYDKEKQKWRCKCECGNAIYRSSYEINKGYTWCTCKSPNKFTDMTGRQFGEWRVLSYVGNGYWECECSCGNIKSIQGYSLRSGESTSCGCKNKKLIGIQNQKFGKLTVIKYNRPYWECKCDCGKTVNVLSHNLRNGSTTSCGCSRILFSKDEILDKLTKYQENHNEKPFIYDLAREFNVQDYTMHKYVDMYDLNAYINKSFKSRYEKEISDIVGKCIRNSRQIIPPQELDIYIPEKKLAIEFNGDYWHSTVFKDKYYHQQKTIACAKQGIQLIHIFEHEWLNPRKQKIIKEILNKSNNKRVYARNTVVSTVSKSELREFLDDYHLQGYCECSKALGLYMNNELISVMTFGTPRFHNKYEWEIIRYCSKAGINIVGGAQKLFKRFLKDENPSSILTYSDITKFTGNIYIELGFKVTEKQITEPGYVWVKPGSKDVLSRYKTNIKNLSDFKSYGDTEDEIMYNLGYYKVYDSGNLRMEWIR